MVNMAALLWEFYWQMQCI